MNKQRIVKAALVNLFSRVGLGVLGFIQVILIAKAFGVSITTDAYMVAIWIPLFIWGMGDSVLVYSLVPYLVSLQVKEGKNSSRESVNDIFSWFLLIMLAATIGIYFGSEYIVRILVPGFSDEGRILTAGLLRWLSPAILLGGLTAFLTAILYALKKFTVPAIVALLPDIGAICFLVFGVEQWGISAVVMGFLSGLFVQLIILVITLLRSGNLPGFRLSGIKKIKDVSMLIGPRVGGVGMNRAIVGVDRFFASMLEAGAVSILAYSYKITQLPVSMAVSAFGKTLIPVLSKDVAQGNMDNVRKFIPRAVGYLLFVLAPMVLLIIFFSEPIIRILYQRGSFSPEATLIASHVLVFYSLAMLFQSIGIIFSGVFYIMGDTWTPFKITAISLILNVVLDAVLIKFFGIPGIAIATLGVAAVSMVLLYIMLSIRIGGIKIVQFINSLMKIAVATGIMGLVIWGLSVIFTQPVPYNNVAGQFLQMGSFSLLSWIIFLFACRLLKLEEYLTVELILGRKFWLQKQQ